MNEQRQQAYFNLIQRLLSCPNSEEPEILAANYDLLDVDLLQAMKTVVKVFSQRGSEKAAHWANRLRNLSTQIAQALTIPQSPQTQGDTENLDAYLKFLQQVLKATAESGSDVNVVYPLLANNTDKLDGVLVEILRRWGTNRLREVEANVAKSIAVHIVNFSNLIRQFPLGNKASNMEIAITGYEIVLSVITRDTFPQEWAMTQNNLGVAYSERILGEKAENIEQAIDALSAALSVNTEQAFPQQWAMTQNNLGAAYSNRIQGKKAENIEQAITAFSAAFTIYTREAFPQQWAATQINLGVAYFDRITGERAENIEEAINAYSNALSVYTHETPPQEWATTQNNLGNAYVIRIKGEKAENIEQALAAYSAALSVYTHETSPQLWAKTQNNLGPAYFERILGEKAENIEQALAAYSAALSVYTHETSPRDYAMTQVNLANAYVNRIKGEKVENIEQAITAYSNALRVYTHETSPQQWGMTQNGLGSAYCERILGESAENIEQAIAAYSAALTVFTRQAFPELWASTQNNLGLAYHNRILGEEVKNIEQAIAAFSAALSVYTREAFPELWASTQNNLGLACNHTIHRILRERAENIEQAIATFSPITGEKAEITEQAITAFSRIKEEKAEIIEQAIAAFSAALTVFTRQAFPQDWAKTQINLGNAYRDRILGERAENLERAIGCYQQALEVKTLDAFPEHWAKTQINLGLAYSNRILGERAENLELAIACSQNALLVYTFDAFPQKHAGCLSYLGMTYQNTKAFTLAYNTFKSAIATVESLRSEIVSEDESKRKQAEEFNLVYSSMVEVCLELGNRIQAIEYVERSKTRNLVERILESDRKTIFPPEVVTQLETYRDEIATGQAKIQNGKAENPKVLAQHLQELRQQRNELQDHYLPVGYGFKFDSFQTTLDERTAIIEWYILNDKILAFIVKHTGEVTVWQSQPEDRKALGNWGIQYLHNYYNQKDQWLNSLGEELKKLALILHIDEILTQIPKHCDQLILIPHWFLHLFPLHALPVSQNPENSACLLDLFPRGVGYAPSCQLLQQVQKRQRPDFQSLFAIQNPTEDLSFTDLEVESILSYFPEHQVLPKKQATKAALSQAALQLKEANYLHFSCHGLFNLNSPQNSCLVLADAYVSPIPANANPEIYLIVSDDKAIDLSKCLTLGNLFERNERNELIFDFSQSRLVVLSACETGLIDFQNTSDEYIGLPSGFLYAGSSSVVSSLWTVNDLSTSFLVIKFIQILKSATDMSVPLAMNQAQRWLRDATKEELQEWMIQLPLNNTKKGITRRQINKMTGEKPFDSPYHWAAFTAVGK